MNEEWRNEIVTKGAAIDAQEAYMADHPLDGYEDELTLIDILRNLPPAQPNYQEVLGWLLAYHTMSFDLHGRYLPHEVISWLINDFSKNFIAERKDDE